MALISGSGDKTGKVAGSTGIGFPKLTTTERNALSSVVEGTVIYNNTENRLEFYNDAGNWVEVNKTPLTATGGSIVLASGKKVHVFTSPGTFAVSQGTTTAEVLVVAGGGSGGGGRHCGGGGAGA